MAYKYPIAISENGCQMIAYKCDNYQEFESGKCGQDYKPMEFNFDFYDNPDNRVNETNSNNNLFIKTSDRYPYCLFHYQIVVIIVYWNITF